MVHRTAVFYATDPEEPGAYTYLAEFDSYTDAYSYASGLQGKAEYKRLSIILVDVMRKREMAPEEAVRLIFSPKGYLINTGDEFRSKLRKALE